MEISTTKQAPLVVDKVGLSYHLGIPIKTIDKYVMDRVIPYHKFRGSIRFNVHEVLEATKVDPPQKLTSV